MNEILNNRYTGWMKTKIKSICPNDDELSILLEEPSTAPEYAYEKKDGTKCCLIDIYLTDVNDENMFKYSIHLEDKERISASGTKLFINQIGDTQWCQDEESLWDSFKNFESVSEWKLLNGEISKYYKLGAKPNSKIIHGTKTYKTCIVGEEEIIHLIKMTDEAPNLKSEETSFFINVDGLFDGDFSKLKRRIQLDTPVFCAFAYVDGPEHTQKIFRKFLPLNMASDLYNNSPNKYTLKLFNAWHSDFDYVKENVDGVIYHFGKLSPFKEEFLPKRKVVMEDEADY